MIKAIMLDVDGTLVSFETHKILQSSVEALKEIHDRGIRIVIATGRAAGDLHEIAAVPYDGIISLNDYQQFTGKFLKKLKEENIDILKIYFCPHNEKDHCHCKKPKPGMIEQAKKDFLIDMNNSIYIGDSHVDYLLAKHFNLTFYGINYNGDNVKSYRSILEISKQIKKIQNK